MNKNGPLSASELYAISQGAVCQGNQECHWCGSPCQRTWLHDDPVMPPFTRIASKAKRPANPYICVGCFMWRRKRITVKFLNGGYKDSQSPQRWSWWITEEGAWALAGESQFLWDRLLNPPSRFALMFLDDQTGVLENHLQQGIANDNPIVKGSTPLHFTVNGIPHKYSIYELKEALKRIEIGKEPGVQYLIRTLGPCNSIPKILPEEEEKKLGPSKKVRPSILKETILPAPNPAGPPQI